MKQSLVALVITLWVVLIGGLAGAAPESGYEPYVPPNHLGDPSVPLFVLLAYASIWLVVLLFVFSVWRRQRRVEVEMRAMQRELGGGQ